MTEELERPVGADAVDDAVVEAIAVIDQALAHMLSRELVSSGEVADLLLDVRTALTATSGEPV